MNQPTETLPAVRQVDTLATFTLQPKTLSEAMEYAKLIAASQLCPPEYRDKPADVLIAIQMGLEVAGCSPLQALQSIAVINGRPTMWGDLVLAVVRRSGFLASIEERDPAECETAGEGKCTVSRKDSGDVTTRTFTMAMAEKAGLVKRSGTTGTWATHPGRMLQMRARSWALRDAFGDVLKGLHIREEVQDYTIEDVPTRTVAMPQRLEAPASVDTFLQETARPTATVRKTGAVGTSEASSGGDMVWTGYIEAVPSKNGTKKDKTPYTLFNIKGADGTVFSTFEESAGHAAEAFRETGEQVRIAWKPSRDGKYKDLVSIEAAPAEEGVPA